MTSWLPEVKVIDGVEYVRTPPVGRFWLPPEQTTAPLVCDCGCKTFTIHFLATYTTSAKCTACGHEEVVHEG